MNPAMLTITAGDRVTWTNAGILAHDVASGVDPTPDGAWASPLLQPGESWMLTFESPGTYSYFCPSHPNLMPGTIVVEG